MKSFPDDHFDLAIVDPPYGISATSFNMGTNKTRSGRSVDGQKSYPAVSTATRLRLSRLGTGAGKLKNRALNTMNCEWDLYPPTQEYFTELFRVSKNQIIWGGNYFDLPPTRCFIVWNKNQPWDNFSQAEYAWTSYDRPAKLFTYSNRGGANSELKIHPTQKPKYLYNFCLKHFAEPGFKILDTHLGSGVIRVCAYHRHLDFTGFEIDRIYYDASISLFNNSVKQFSLDLSDKKATL